MREILFFILFSYSSSLAQVQLDIQYNGNSASTDISLYKYKEYITNSTEKVADNFSLSSSISKKVNLDLSQPSRLLIKDNSRSRRFYVQPDYSYQINIKDDTIHVLSQDGINQSIELLNFKTKNYHNNIYEIHSGDSPHKKKLIHDQLSRILLHQREFSGTEYQNQLVRYKLAMDESDTYRIIGEKKAYNKMESGFITDQMVQFNNPEYLRFIFNYYFSRFQSYRLRSKKYREDMLGFNIMKHEASLITNDLVRQLVLIEFARIAYNSAMANNVDVLSLLDSLSVNGLHPHIRKASDILVRRFSTVQKDAAIPDVGLTDLSGNRTTLSNYFGKYALLDFWFVGCGPCHQAIPLKKELSSKFGDCLEIISINPLNSTEEIEKYKSKNELSWTFLQSNRYDGSINALNIRSYPTYYLLDPTGKIILIPKSHVRGEDNFKLIEEELKNRCK